MAYFSQIWDKFFELFKIDTKSPSHRTFLGTLSSFLGLFDRIFSQPIKNQLSRQFYRQLQAEYKFFLKNIFIT